MATSDSNSYGLPQVPTITKDCHCDVTQELRAHMVQRLAQAIFPALKFSWTGEQIRMLDNFAKKIECLNFEAANSQSEYYRLLAEKTYLILKELEKKRAERNRRAAANQIGQEYTTSPGTSGISAAGLARSPRIVLQPGVIPQMANMQHHPNMSPSTGIPQIQQIPPHIISQSSGAVQQHGMPNMEPHSDLCWLHERLNLL